MIRPSLHAGIAACLVASVAFVSTRQAAGQAEPAEAPSADAPPANAAPAAAAPDSAAPAAAPAGPVAATIDGAPVFVKEIEVLAKRGMKSRSAKPVLSPAVQAEVLKQVIQRRLATRALEREGGYFTEAEIEKEFGKIATQAKALNLTVEELAAREGITVDTFRNEIIWQVGWERYVGRHLTESMEGYFKAHQKEYDGTLVRASHILLRPDVWREPKEALVKRAEQIREQIESGKLTFEQAAEQFSAGPSRAKGGDVGFFPRQGVMVDEFAKAAFELEPGQVSQPVSTSFGVHLIRVTDVKPGNKQWTQVLDQMRAPAAIDLFEKLAEKETNDAKIEFTGIVPYFKPGTDELVVPASTTP